MDDHVYLDDRDPAAVIRAVEADVKTLIALTSALLRTLAAASPAAVRAVGEEARYAAKADPVAGRQVLAFLDALSLRLALTPEPAHGVSDLEWAPVQAPTAKG
jgi:hypothetical protein